MTHNELVKSMKRTIICMCHTQAYAKELAYKLRRNLSPILKETPGSKAVYVTALDRALNNEVQPL